MTRMHWSGKFKERNVDRKGVTDPMTNRTTPFAVNLLLPVLLKTSVYGTLMVRGNNIWCVWVC